MKRREMLVSTGAAVLGLSAFPFRWLAAAEKKQRVLYFTRSAGFEHSVVRREGGRLSHSEQVFTELGQKHGFEVECSKEGSLFDGDLDKYDCLAFYTSGNLLGGSKDGGSPMSAEGKQRLLDAIKAGKPFVGIHAATDTFRSGGIDPFIEMIGGEFVSHGAQQVATMRVASPGFPGVESLGRSFDLNDEWYAFRKFNPEMHVILVQETEGMKGDMYNRPPFPATWARMHGKGRVFYTSMGHREDVWTGDVFQKVLLGGLAWALGNADADVAVNFDKVTPGANQ
ncbi:MAG: ThuA domain-containing protein [Thermoguttaceae bacterium]|jgi:type 1 glutamine amidotransferase|nr:ThuA domain-containing protein [Thermoguttaceae bacterium]